MYLPVFNDFALPNSKLIAQGVELVNRANHLFLFTKEEGQHIGLRRKALQAYRQQLEDSELEPVKGPSFFQKNRDMEAQTHAKHIFYQWREQQQQSLAKSGVWEQLSEEAMDKASMQALHEQWQQEGLLSDWNHQAIIYIAYEVLPQLITYQQQALRQCQQRNIALPEKERQKYIAYAKDFLAQAEQLKNHLAHSMCARLKTVMHSHFKRSDVMIETVSQIKSLGGLSPDFVMPKYAERMTNQQFMLFHAYLEKNNPHLLAQAKLSWLNDKARLIKRTQLASHEVLLIPTALAKFVPPKQPWPKWLFPKACWRWEFFKNKSMLFAFLTSTQLNDAQLDSQNRDTTIKALAFKEQELNALMKEVKAQAKAQRSRFWHRKSNRFFNEMNQWLVKEKNQLLRNKMTYFEALVDEIKTLDFREDKGVFASFTRCQQVKEMLKALRKFINSPEAAPLLKQRLEKVTPIASELILKNKAFALLKWLSENELIEASQVEFLKDFYDVIALKNSEELAQFKEMVADCLQKIYANLKREFNSYRVMNVRRHQENILCFNYIVAIFGSDEQKEQLKNKTLKYCLRYIESLLLSNGVGYGEPTAQMEGVLLCLGNKIQSGGQSIKALVEELKLLRENEAHAILIAKCKSWALLLNESLLTKRLSKESAMLDDSIVKIVKDDPALQYDDSAVDALFHARDKLVVQKSQMIKNDARDDLFEHEQVIAGINDEKNTKVKALIEASATAQHALNQMQAPGVDYVDKNQQLVTLRSSMRAIFSKAKPARVALKNSSTFFNTREFFEKQYVDERCLFNGKESSTVYAIKQ